MLKSFTQRRARTSAGRGDMNDDGDIDSADAPRFTAAYTGGQWDPRADLDDDGDLPLTRGVRQRRTACDAHRGLRPPPRVKGGDAPDQTQFNTKKGQWYPDAEPHVAQAFSDVDNQATIVGCQMSDSNSDESKMIEQLSYASVMAAQAPSWLIRLRQSVVLLTMLIVIAILALLGYCGFDGKLTASPPARSNVDDIIQLLLAVRCLCYVVCGLAAFLVCATGYFRAPMRYTAGVLCAILVVMMSLIIEFCVEVLAFHGIDLRG